jgi:hypothetical protein
MLHVADAEILEEPGCAVSLWGVRGIPGTLYPTKIVAEVAARLAFSHEGPDQRYARIFYTLFVPQD